MLCPPVTSRTASCSNFNVKRARTVFAIAVLLACIDTPSMGWVFRGQGQRTAKRNLTGFKWERGVQHISPGTLLGSVLIPIPTPREFEEVRQDYDRLCELEHKVA